MKARKTLSLILSIIMLVSSLICLPTNAFAGSNDTECEVVLNPLFYYEDDVDDYNYDYVKAKAVFSSDTSSYSNDVVYENPVQAAEALRDAMVKMQNSITLKFYCSKDFDDSSVTGVDVFSKLCSMAFSEELSVSPVDGDYLGSFSNGVCYSNAKKSIIGDKVYCEVTYNILYKTTKEEEQILTEKINNDLLLLNLDGKSEYQKIKAIHDYICESTIYDYDNISGYYKYTAYGTLVLGHGVCSGYSYLFHRLCKEVGLVSRIICGEDHAWNIVKIGELFYYVDVTWDDCSEDPNHPDPNNYIHYWMLKGKNDFIKHTPTGKYATEEFWASYPLSDYAYVCMHSDNDELISVVEPTCTEQGYKNYYCSLCDEYYKEDIVDAPGHDYTIVVKEPACEHCGYTTYTCNRCGYEYIDDWKETLDHDYNSVVIPPTCGDDGYTKYTCNRCGYEYYVDYVPATGIHDYYVSKREEATCEWDGYVKYTCTVCDDYYYQVIPSHGHDYKSVVIQPTCTAQGYTKYTCTRCGDSYDVDYVNALGHEYDNGKVTKCSICGATKSSSANYYPKTITLSTTSYTYDGKTKTPSVKAKDNNGKTLKKNTDYTVSYAGGRKNVGRYAVKITFKGNYSGTKTLYFTIKPKGISLSKVTAAKKGFKVYWKKQSSQITGYQIQYSTNSKFTNAKTVTLTKNSYTSKSISKLSAKKKYYVRIRTYKTVGSTKYYSSWSKAKYVTTKK
ncbi:MAG: transglutaminase domain-containing protein [Eubacterium sp.]